MSYLDEGCVGKGFCSIHSPDSIVRDFGNSCSFESIVFIVGKIAKKDDRVN
jgi:hypothetical protein